MTGSACGRVTLSCRQPGGSWLCCAALLFLATSLMLLANFLAVTRAVLGYVGLERFINCMTSKTSLYVYLTTAAAVQSI